MSGLRRGKRVYTAPEWLDDNFNVKPPDFAQPETRGGYETVTAKHVMRPSFDVAPKPPAGVVPLKCDQLNSHADGASLFNAPVADEVQKLKTPEDRGMESLRKRFSEYDMRTNTPKAAKCSEMFRTPRAPTDVASGTIPQPQGEYNRLDSLEVMMRSRF